MSGSQSKVYRVTGRYQSGRKVSHLVGAVDVIRAIQSVHNADNRIVRIESALPISLSW